MFLIRVKHLVHYYHIGTRSSHVGNYRTGTMNGSQRPILHLQGSHDTTHRFHQMVVSKDTLGVGGGRISPDKSPPRSCGILNPPTHLEGNPCLTP